MKKDVKEYFQDLLEIGALIIALAAVIVLVFFLLLAYNKCIIFTEPVLSVRLSEILMGLISIPVLINLIRKKFIKMHGKS